MRVAVLNAGSSSLKYKLFLMPSAEVLESKIVEHIGETDSLFSNHHEALESLEIDFSTLDAIGHRVVHGGEDFKSSVLIDKDVSKAIEKLIPLAPLHNPANLEGIKVALSFAPKTAQVAVFDTAFHSTMPKEAYLYALPHKIYDEYKVRRYGFHGTSHSYVAKKAAQELGRELQELNLITLHLGNGASVCAIEKGKSIDTSMGFTPLEGLIMGSRCGDIDPAIVLYLQREVGLSVSEVDKLLNKESGLLGICGENDVRSIVESENESAQLALQMMVRRIQKYIGSYLALLGEVDALVFTGGIGEHSAFIRESVMNSKLFKELKVMVVETDEELEIANEVVKTLKKKAL
jgi:acetate kinase